MSAWDIRKITSEGLHTTTMKVDAVCLAPAPKNQCELLRLLHYYGKFIPNLATLIHPLNSLLKTNALWNWSKECAQVFNEAKDKLTSAAVLTHYDPKLPLHLARDASTYGVGTVISHVFSDGSERPVAFPSKTLSASERNYSQLEKKALSLILVYGSSCMVGGLYLSQTISHSPQYSVIRKVSPIGTSKITEMGIAVICS